MAQHGYKRQPHEIDMTKEEQAIRRNSAAAFIVTVAAYIAAWLFAPAIAELPEALPERFAFAALCWAVPGLVLLVAIMMVSTARRFSIDDIGGQAAGPPSEKLAVKAAFLQNTLEQTVLAGAFYFALAASAGGQWMALLPVAAVLFVIGRVLFFAGYKRGAKGRAFGMALTMLPAVIGYLIVAYLLLPIG